MPPRERYSPPSFDSYSDGDGDDSAGRIQVRQKTVLFSQESPQIKPIRHRNDYSRDEKLSIWYTRKDYKKFRKSCKESIQRIDFYFANNRFHSWEEEADTQSTGSFCARGLERYTRDGSIRYLERRTDMMTEMMFLGHSQYHSTDLATLVSAHSAPCVAEARARGRQDERSALRYSIHNNKNNLNLDNTTAAPPNNKRPLLVRMPRLRPLMDRREKSFGFVSRRQLRMATCRLLRDESAQRLLTTK
jgi:hypothetical protein